MANPKYPLAQLPFPVRNGYGEALLRPFQRKKMDDGQSITYRRHKTQPNGFNITWMFSWPQLKYFEGFVEYELGGGGQAFDMQLSPALPESTYKFTSDPKVKYIADKNQWAVSVTLEELIDGPAVEQPLTYLPEWPAELPEPEKDEYEYGSEGYITYTAIEDGQQVTRKRFTDRLTTYRVKWFLEKPEYDRFKSFLTDDLANGVGKFLAPFANGFGAIVVKAKFVEPPSFSELDSMWVVKGILETTQAPVMSRLEYQYPDGIQLADTITMRDTVKGQSNFNYSIDETTSLAEAIRFELERTLAEDTVVFDETTTLFVDYARIAEDTVSFAETAKTSTDYSRSAAELLQLKEVGVATTETYSTGEYFAEDYAGTTVLF